MSLLLAGALGVLPSSAVGQGASRGAAPAMARIPGAAYTIGSDDGPTDERPAHPVALEPFLIDRHEVTSVLYGSDYPHNIGSMKGMLRRVNGLPSRTARMVRQSNAERIFRL